MWKFALALCRARLISELCNLSGHYNRTENKQLSPVSPYTQTNHRNTRVYLSINIPESKYYSP